MPVFARPTAVNTPPTLDAPVPVRLIPALPVMAPLKAFVLVHVFASASRDAGFMLTHALASRYHGESETVS